ncbi:MAG: PIG-L deacetylase family protein [Patescibacteria group bacterium]|nr:PIG-L family deacetylase [Patescibacteria group bacterium]
MIRGDFHKVFNDKKRILIIMPHPDDAEIYCGGTIAHLVKSKKEVRIVKATFGERGCQQEKITLSRLKKIRKREDSASMEVLGIKPSNNIYLDLGDGKVENTIDTIKKIAFQIRLFKPDLVITTNPEDSVIRFDKNINWINHRDHRNTAQSTLDAILPYSRDLLFFPEQLKGSRAISHSVTEFLLTDYYDHPDNVLINVTDFINTRVKAHSCHKSQYSLSDAKESADFFTIRNYYPKGKRYESFRYVVAD